MPFVCQACNSELLGWSVSCSNCKVYGSVIEEQATLFQQRPPREQGKPPARSIAFDQIETQSATRVYCHRLEQVLGGGIVPGSLILIGGEPGIGKSTLLLQIADDLTRNPLHILYISGEESPVQVKMRGKRLGITGVYLDRRLLSLLAETNLENILYECGRIEPDVVIIDSTQTISSSALDSLPGSVNQVRYVAGELLALAKNTNTIVFLIGHITKDGSLAGPKTLEHIVDVVLYFENETGGSMRTLRASKNRFGVTGVVGEMEMTAEGLVSARDN